MLGYDIDAAEVERIVSDLHGECSDLLACDPALVPGEHRLLAQFADLRALIRSRHDDDLNEGELVRSPQEHLHAFLRSLDAQAEGLPNHYARQLRRALRHYGIETLDRTPALEEACYRLFLAQQRAATVRRAVLAILDRRLEQAVVLAGASAADFREVLDRLAAATGGRDPVLADLARQVRVCVLRRARDRRRAGAGLCGCRRRPGSARARPRAPRSRRAAGRPRRLPAAAAPRRSYAGWQRRNRPLSGRCWRRSRDATTACARSSRSPRRPSTATGSSPRATGTRGRHGTSRRPSWSRPGCRAPCAVATWAATLPAGELAVADFYSRVDDAARPAELAERIRTLLAGVALPPCVHRIVVGVTGAAGPAGRCRP